tara:strand:+ start:250373 stop:251008 length:636 start_codon:yes stop_codon:yes gene_type:complete
MITAKPVNDGRFAAFATLIFMIVTAQLFWKNPGGIADLLPAIHSAIFQDGEVWRLFTAQVIHSDVEHLLSNMLMLTVFSYLVFGYFGFGVYPLLSYFLGSLVNLISIYTYPTDVRLLGASGLVYLLGGFWLTMYFLIQRQYLWTHRFLRVLGIAMLLFFPTTFQPTTSYRTHAIGMAVGALMAAAYFIKNKKYIRSFETFKDEYVEEPLFH